MMEAAAAESCRDGKNWCYFHPNQLVIGVCAFCLNQRLLILAASDEQQNGSRSHRRRRRSRKTVPHIHLPKIFALTNYSFLKQRKAQDQRSSFTHSSSSSSTQEESFISIKFEENGAASWEKSTTMASVEKYCEMTSWNQNDIKLKKKKKEEERVVSGAVVVVEPRGGRGGGGASSSLRWRKRIGHLFQLMKWRKSSSSSAAEAMGNVGTKLEGHVKVRHGWIRTLTKNNNNNNKDGGLMSTGNRNRC